MNIHLINEGSSVKTLLHSLFMVLRDTVMRCSDVSYEVHVHILCNRESRGCLALVSHISLELLKSETAAANTPLDQQAHTS